MRLLKAGLPAASATFVAALIAVGSSASSHNADTEFTVRNVNGDWLVTPWKEEVAIGHDEEGKEVTLSNGLISRTWRVSPNAATVGFENLMTGASIIRAVKPEADVVLDGKRYNIGGLTGQPDHAYLLQEWLDIMDAEPGSFEYTGFEFTSLKVRFPWKRKRYSASSTWPPPGIELILHFRPPAGVMEGLTLQVHHVMYQGIPLVSKWITIRNGTSRTIRLNSFTSEILAVVEYESTVENRDRWEYPNLHVETDYAMHGMDVLSANKAISWQEDPEYRTQVNYRYETPLLLRSQAPFGPELDIEPGGVFESFRTWILVFDSTERERKGLAVRRMYRTIAPWVTENPIIMHVRRAEPEAVRLAIDQCAEVGFEMVIMTFGSGFNIENDDPQYLAQIRELVEYAHERGIELGGYSLLASRRISDEHDVINPETGKRGGAIFGNSPCLGSEWGLEYFRKLYDFYEKTGLDMLEHDGSYPGDLCASTTHPGHRDLGDSQWQQWKIITDFYKWCRGKGIYLNIPDYYFLTGSTKVAMGYRETNWSLPRAQQIIHARQNIYDGTWTKTPSMGWMFVPLVEYHGGGAAATLEPLSEHLDAYEAHLANNFGLGVQACYRGPRLYDTEETRRVVKKWVDFYHKYRDILDSDLIHLRRADGRDIDYMMHVNPRLEIRGLVIVYNPLNREVIRELKLSLYYTGLTDSALISEQGDEAKVYKLDREYTVELEVRVAAGSVTWFTIRER